MGFLDSEYQQFIAQVYISSTRYIYKSDLTNEYIFDEVKATALTREKVEQIADKLKKAKAIWIDTEEVYLSGRRQTATVLSFQAQILKSPFTPTRFYTLLILDNNETIELSDDELETHGIYKITSNIYHTISSQFRL